MRIDDNLDLAQDGSIRCRHCETAIGDKDRGSMAVARTRESASSNAGPGVRAAPEQFTDRPIILRQRFCPGCLVLLATEIVPSDEPDHRSWVVSPTG